MKRCCLEEEPRADEVIAAGTTGAGTTPRSTGARPTTTAGTTGSGSGSGSSSGGGSGGSGSGGSGTGSSPPGGVYLSVGAIAGIAVGAAALAAILTAIIALCCFRRLRRRGGSGGVPTTPAATVQYTPMPQPHHQQHYPPPSPYDPNHMGVQSAYDPVGYAKTDYGQAQQQSMAPTYATTSPVGVGTEGSLPSRHASPAMGGLHPPGHAGSHEMQAPMAYEMSGGTPMGR